MNSKKKELFERTKHDQLSINDLLQPGNNQNKNCREEEEEKNFSSRFC